MSWQWHPAGDAPKLRPRGVALDRLTYTDAAAASYEQAMARISRHFVPLMLDAGHLAAGYRLLDVRTGMRPSEVSAMAQTRIRISEGEYVVVTYYPAGLQSLADCEQT